jgi:Patatin-like phospholipase
VSEGPGGDVLQRRIDVYLSGGGYRAALGALGVFYFLAFDGRWADVRRIVSVSGGSIVNAHLALARPARSDVPDELTRLFRTLTSRRRSLCALVPALAALLIGTAAVIVTVRTLSDSWTVMVPVALVWLPIGLFYAIRLWLWLLYRPIVGGAYLDDLVGCAWTIEHVLVATDLSEHGSVFFLVNAIRPQVASLAKGHFDARDIAFGKTLRATTALPPILPPTRLVVRSKSRRRDSPLDDTREYLWAPRVGGDSMTAWLADGGVTGNLGIQLDSTLAPDNLALLEIAMSKTMAGTPDTRTKYSCRWHDDQPAWNCFECLRETFVVDASGTVRPTKRLAEKLLGIPLLGLPVFAVRSLEVMYESSLVDDQGHAGDVLVGVVRTDQMIRRIAVQKWPLSSSPDWRVRAAAAGRFVQSSENLATPACQHRMGMSDLMRACWAARSASSEVKTRLWAVPAPVAARVVASGYLNACLNTYRKTHGLPEVFASADRGIRRLADLLGPDAALDDWWDGVLRDISTDD